MTQYDDESSDDESSVESSQPAANEPSEPSSDEPAEPIGVGFTVKSRFHIFESNFLLYKVIKASRYHLRNNQIREFSKWLKWSRQLKLCLPDKIRNTMDLRILTNLEEAMGAAMTVIRNLIEVGNHEDRPHIQRQFNNLDYFYEIFTYKKI